MITSGICRIAVALSVVLSTVLTATGAVRYVSPTGGNTAPYTSWGSAARNIQSAISACGTGDTVQVAAGTYLVTSTVMITNGITLEGVSGAGVTIINGGNSVRCAWAQQGAKIRGFTLTAGYTGQGGGGLVLQSGTAADSCIISGNRAVSGGGIFAVDSVRISNCTIQNNTCEMRGGGAMLGFVAGTPVMENSIVRRNTARDSGGGVYISGTAWVSNCTIAANTALTNGGGIMMGSVGNVMDSTIARNTAGDEGGGVASEGFGSIKRCIIRKNYSPYGGGIHLTGDTKVENCVIVKNRADFWGGGLFSGEKGIIYHCTIVSNSTPTGFGGGIYSWNTATVASSIVYFNIGSGGSSLSNYGGGLAWSYSCAGPTPAGAGNIGQDPLFVSRSSLDLRLQTNSPCIDRIISFGSIPDIRKVPRPLDGNNNGFASPDMGAYECVNLQADSDSDTYRDGLEVSRHSSPINAADRPYAHFDFNADRISDLILYQPSSSTWFGYDLAGGSVLSYGAVWGAPGSRTAPGLYNAGNRWDATVFEPATGNWFVRAGLSGAWLYYTLGWGNSSMTPVTGDYDGDGFYDFALYEPGTGKWYVFSIHTGRILYFGVSWGGPSMTPVPGDYDADGIWDLAVWDTATGNWYVYSPGAGKNLITGFNWGSGTMTPVPGDFNGDGCSDLALYHPSSGGWCILNTATLRALTIVNWGNASMTPVCGDFNGDGKSDLAVYQPGTGLWYIARLNGAVITPGLLWGGPGMDAVNNL